LVKELLNHEKQQKTIINPVPDRTLPYAQENFIYLKQAMEKVLKPGGTAHRIGAGLSYSMAGKTGTVQNPHGKDHAIFIGFAPLENPQIAVAVVVENAGFGASWACPIASMMLEQYLTGEVKRKDLRKRMANTILNESVKKW
jgi:penicillin-binding protein 2